MSNYRAAKCIELHDSNLALTTDNECYAFTSPTGRTESADKPAFSIKFCDIKMLAEMFNVNCHDSVLVPKASDQTCAEAGKPSSIDFIEFPIYKMHHDYSDSHLSPDDKIAKLECEILSDKMVNIRTTSETIDSNEPHIEEITYCGSFTIWWASTGA